MCQGKLKTWITFNLLFFSSIFSFIIIFSLFINNFFCKFDDNYDLALTTLLSTNISIIGFYLANYKVKKDNRINNIDNYIQDFTNSRKLIKNILENFEYTKLDSLAEIRSIVKTIDKHFGLHYFNIFIGNSKLASIHISEQIGNFMVNFIYENY